MNLVENDACKEFLAALQPFGDAYESVTVRYLAGRKSEAAPWGLLQATIELRDAPITVDQPQFESRHLRAGVVSLTGANVRPAALIESLLSGQVPLNGEPLIFLEQHGGGYQLQVLKSQPSDNKRQYSVGLRLAGGSVQQIADVYQLGWQLLGANPPFESVPEIVRFYGLGEWQQHNSCVEVWITPVLRFTEATHLKGKLAVIGVRLAKSLDSDRVTLVHKVRGEPGHKFSEISASSFNWSADKASHGAVVTFEVPERRKVLVSLRYAGAVHEYIVLEDETIPHNPRRTLYELVDPGLAKLAALLESLRTGEHDADKFEQLVERLFWLSGFGTHLLAGDKRTRRASDILAFAPSGNVLVIECTTTILKADKISQLARRLQNVRDALSRAGGASAEVIGILVTSLPFAEIEVDAHATEGSGIAVYSNENLSTMLASSEKPLGPDEHFAELSHRLMMAALAAEAS